MKREIFNYQWEQTHIKQKDNKWYIVWPDEEIAYEIGYKKLSDAVEKRNSFINEMKKILNHGIK